MCSTSETRVVHIGVECCCCREPETPHTHAHDIELMERLMKNAAGQEVSQEE
jgi:hypothetical protein